MRKLTYALLVLLLLTATACDHSPTAPTTPTSSRTVSVLFSGTVWERGPANVAQPVAGAAVTWCDVRSCRDDAVLTNADGSYNIWAQDAFTAPFLRVAKPDYETVLATASMVEASGTVKLDIQLKPTPPEGGIFGVVTEMTAAGPQAVVGVKVWPCEGPPFFECGASKATGEEGHYRFAFGRIRGTVYVWVDDKKYAEYSSPVFVEGFVEHNIQLKRR